MATANPWLTGTGFDAYRSAGWRYLGLTAVIIVLLVEVLVKASGAANPLAAPASTPAIASYINKPVPASLVTTLKTASQKGLTFTQNVASLSTSVKVSSATGPVKGTPTVFYQGADFCPFCAATRWSLILALMRFGTFSNLHYMASSPTDVFPNTPTFTFAGASYTSPYLHFDEAEIANRTNSGPLQTPSAANTAAADTYDTAKYVGSAAGTIPFLDVANRYVWVGAPFNPTVMGTMRWQPIANALMTTATTGSGSAEMLSALRDANVLTAAICSVDGQKPAAVCSASGVVAAKGGLPK